LSKPPADLVAAVLRDPTITLPWSGRQWSLLMQQARLSGLLARAWAGQQTAGAHRALLIPGPVAAHMEAAERVCRAQHAEIHREVGHLARALESLDAPVVLLKGAAYVMAGLPAATGRVFSDIDIMVPKHAIAQAEALLAMHGWMSDHHSAYYQRYYREWMHELPPMHHVQRGTVLDVHHTILPETARLRPDPRKLFQDAIPLPGHRQLCVLSPADMLLHSMTHLFMNDDMSHALRDLSDLDLLLGHFGAQPDFWDGLVDRAAALDLTRPLYYGLRYTSKVWGREAPAAVTRRLNTHAPAAPLRWLMDTIWLRVLRSPHASAAPPWQALALFALSVRGHWLRMPPLLLVRHLTIKALKLVPKSAAPTEAKTEPKGG
jgi:hypothetical protein